MKPFLHLSIRDHDRAVAAEFDAIAAFGGLKPGQLVQLRVEQAPLPVIRPDDYSGLIIGGGQFNTSDEIKTDNQRRVEGDLARIVDVALAAHVPLIGLCYGVGIVTQHLGGLVDRTYGESTSAVEVTLTEHGRVDPLFEGVPDRFMAFTGHKEACSRTPNDAVLLATGTACPVQSFRVGQRAYVTQFHPELDVERLVERMVIYRNAGYFDPDEFDNLVEAAHAAGVDDSPGKILRNFVELFAR
ncbi:glutamine amidotransferase [Propioniciclava sinopodophylli]|uniref:glutamine amidotransferase n=1 Tax=Propioniciclava sinopodophylli TaxID=1837344 RepID=UPI002492B727|nr:glutamine amidotransferase [Propioniciclava sinopodophylli]